MHFICFTKKAKRMINSLLQAANDLKIKPLSDLVGERIGDMMKGKTTEEIRKMFNINEEGPCVDHRAKEDFVWDNAWAFE